MNLEIDQVDGATSMYNIERDEWSEGPTLAIPRAANSCCTLGHMLYAVSGFRPNLGFSHCLDKLLTSIEVVNATRWLRKGQESV